MAFRIKFSGSMRLLIGAAYIRGATSIRRNRNTARANKNEISFTEHKFSFSQRKQFRLAKAHHCDEVTIT